MFAIRLRKDGEYPLVLKLDVLWGIQQLVRVYRSHHLQVMLANGVRINGSRQTRSRLLDSFWDFPTLCESTDARVEREGEERKTTLQSRCVSSKAHRQKTTHFEQRGQGLQQLCQGLVR
jgi:hypothetical protein